MATRKPNHIRPALRRKIDETFLPEIHQARWAARLAQLHTAKRHARTPTDCATAQRAIREHYGHKNDLDLTRLELEARRANHAKLPPRKRSPLRRTRYYIAEQYFAILAYWQP
jgi:hypothetical protein